MNGDGLRYIKGISKDKLHVLGRAQAGVEQVLGGDGLAQHVGDALCLAVFFTGFDLIKSSGQLGFLSPILTPKNNARYCKRSCSVTPGKHQVNTINTSSS